MFDAVVITQRYHPMGNYGFCTIVNSSSVSPGQTFGNPPFSSLLLIVKKRMGRIGLIRPIGPIRPIDLNDDDATTSHGTATAVTKVFARKQRKSPQSKTKPHRRCMFGPNTRVAVVNGSLA